MIFLYEPSLKNFFDTTFLELNILAIFSETETIHKQTEIMILFYYIALEPGRYYYKYNIEPDNQRMCFMTHI